MPLDPNRCKQYSRLVDRGWIWHPSAPALHRIPANPAKGWIPKSGQVFENLKRSLALFCTKASMEIDKNSKISITFCRIFGVPVQRDVKLGGIWPSSPPLSRSLKRKVWHIIFPKRKNNVTYFILDSIYKCWNGVLVKCWQCGVA